MAKQKKSDSLESILAQYSVNKEYEFVSTGSITLDALLGGGIALGSMYAFWGAQGSGKSTIAFQIMKRFCKKDMKVAFIDVEKAFNTHQQESFGLKEFVDSGLITVLTVDDYEQCMQLGLALSKSDEYKLVVVDSETELGIALPEEIDITSQQPGQKSRQSAAMLSALKKVFYNANIASIWICHARANIDMMAGPYAPKDKQAGGYGVKHTPDAIVKVAAGQKIKDGDEVVGQILHIVCDKNKFVRPFVQRDVNITFGKGIVAKDEILELAIQQGLITQSGAYFTITSTGETIRGREGLRNLSNDQLKELKANIQPIL